MIEIANLILYWLHQVATVVWIGGIAFILFILIPKSKEAMRQDAGKLIGIVSMRFKLFADWSIILLIVTGISLFTINKASTHRDDPVNYRTLFMIMKHVFFLLMVLIHLYRNYVLTKKIANEQNSSPKITLQKLSLNMVKTVFIFGLIVILLSVVISG